jgi:outer membrane protein assembly factor BamB
VGPDVWVVNETGNSVSEFRLAGGHWLRTLSARRFEFDAPSGIATDGRHLWIPDSADNALTEVDTHGDQVVRVLTSGYGFWSPAPVAESGGRVYVASPPGSSPMVTALSAATGTFEWMMCNTNGPYRFADPQALLVDAGNVWVANATGNSLTVINRRTGALVRRVT